MKKKLKIIGLLLKIAPIAYKGFKKYKAYRLKKAGAKKPITLPPRH
ncbi:hypothetical protein JMA_39940 (plasmid) [Jeotgalibacillus malaysiensis]|uniref:Uncharacterized protein n=1 Tax=Jeotgalibacillus malaysiensis TaxID=1508404 RepID=A0A0B5AXB2_9BACL|nr:hypothetical protein [Jeotgalibacillus malaysiensis]AJD93312.1 hypothetical protein JMA_39940 [Jeotgalibacillus malaysiensis]